ncbi:MULTISPECIES: hypothetical protein [Streptomyces]|jgi:hypothetical protein|nr:MULTISPECIES: hypothetical protein [Streptomyces]SHH72244.1 hypothetical protein SAMN05444521_1596 [Streptomyces sp. 3214.6]SOE07624.1 hypothetical protein SAMN06272765_8530 [Streptomyces sp. Ag109_G2-15]
MLAHGTWLVPTLSAPLAVIRLAEAGGNMRRRVHPGGADLGHHHGEFVVAEMRVPGVVAGRGHSPGGAHLDRVGTGPKDLPHAQSLGNLAASTIAGILWSVFSPAAAFGYLAAWMLLALAGLLLSLRR